LPRIQPIFLHQDQRPECREHLHARAFEEGQDVVEPVAPLEQHARLRAVLLAHGRGHAEDEQPAEHDEYAAQHEKGPQRQCDRQQARNAHADDGRECANGGERAERAPGHRLRDQ